MIDLGVQYRVTIPAGSDMEAAAAPPLVLGLCFPEVVDTRAEVCLRRSRLRKTA